MKFLLNMNVSRGLGPLLANAGNSWRHVADIGLAQATDSAILEEARRSGEVIITHDLDYGHLLVFSGEQRRSVIISRRHDSRPEALWNAIQSVWSTVDEALQSGAIILLEDATVRIRPLPIHRP